MIDSTILEIHNVWKYDVILWKYACIYAICAGDIVTLLEGLGLPSARVVKVENLLHKLEKLIVQRSSFVVMTSGGSAHLKISFIHLYLLYF